ncbi:uncharacterized mitochondrial protein AtMg00810-like [Helianthus annuus]|uniref:uncharacterized mitochondrial protein AtMg00810-like n=1 Tax=Helianthus annuus TaxID=4232 RepID=UPI000B8EFB1C|nr:uncharacterized mitochondrial protein AtMg00810-like [Helianthus annuus]
MTRLAAEFEMKDLGPLSHFLGINVSQQQNTMFLSQKSYATDIIERAGMHSCKPVATPVDTKAKLSATSSPIFNNPTLYRSLAGALQYLTFTRSDISYVVQQVCMHMHAPRIDHWNALKRVIRYLQGTVSLGLTLGPFADLSLRAYTDADWVRCPDTGRSTSATVYIWVQICYPGRLNGKLLSLDPVRRPSIEEWQMSLQNCVGFVTFCLNYIALYRKPAWSIVIISLPYISRVIQFSNGVLFASFMFLHVIRLRISSPRAFPGFYLMISDPVLAYGHP